VSFVEIERRKGSAATTDKPELVVSFSPRGSSKTVCAIVMRPAFTARSGFGLGTYRAAVDAETQAIKVWPAADGTFKARQLKSALVLDLGFIPAFADRNHKKLPASDIALGEGFVIIALPECKASGGANAAAKEKEKQVVPATAVLDPPSSLKSDFPAPLTFDYAGLRIDFSEGQETVSRGEWNQRTSARGARLVEALARAGGSCVGDDFLMKKLWDVKPAGGIASLEMVIADLKGLKKLGLEIRTERGVGRRLVVV